MVEYAECAICLQPVQTAACTLVCGHVFHSVCMLNAVLHDDRCPICRCTLIDNRPRTLVELTINDIDEAVQEDYADARQEQVRYDARRRRLIRSQPRLRTERAAVRGLEARLRALENDIYSRFDDAKKKLWDAEPFSAMRRERMLLMQRRRRRQRIIDVEVVARLGERPAIAFQEDPGNVVARAIVRLGTERARRGPGPMPSPPRVVPSEPERPLDLRRALDEQLVRQINEREDTHEQETLDRQPEGR